MDFGASGRFAQVEALRDEYRSVPLPEDPVSGHLDFSYLDEQRDIVVAKAAVLGIPESDLTSRSPDYYEDDTVGQVIDQYDDDHEVLRQYWEVNEALTQELRPELGAIWEQYLQGSPLSQQALQSQVAPIIQLRDRLRIALRQSNPEIDRLLIKWGHVTRPRTLEGLQQMQQMQLQEQVGSAAPPRPRGTPRASLADIATR